jgi:sporulation protein YlmC with PRC-barrel domain
MNRPMIVIAVTAACLGFASASFAAQPPVTGQAAAAPTPSGACVSDVRAFSRQMQKDGFWLESSDYGYGYAAGGYGYDYPMMGYPAGASVGYQDARPGYEIRNLLASANILAQNGQQQACETVLATTQSIYARYAADFRGRGGSMTDRSGWERQQIAAALPVTDTTAALRSDQLIDTDVRNMQNEGLGSVHDLVINPQTGKIAYLIIARGGLFGFDRTFVPVPWADFKVTANADRLVLDTTKALITAAPSVTDAQFRAAGQFTEQSQKVDAYWKGHFTTKAASN